MTDRALAPEAVDPDESASDVVFEAMGTVEPRAMLTDVVGMDELPQAFEALRRPADQCKVVVDPWG